MHRCVTPYFTFSQYIEYDDDMAAAAAVFVTNQPTCGGAIRWLDCWLRNDIDAVKALIDADGLDPITMKLSNGTHVIFEDILHNERANMVSFLLSAGIPVTIQTDNRAALYLEAFRVGALECAAIVLDAIPDALIPEVLSAALNRQDNRFVEMVLQTKPSVAIANREQLTADLMKNMHRLYKWRNGLFEDEGFNIFQSRNRIAILLGADTDPDGFAFCFLCGQKNDTQMYFLLADIFLKHIPSLEKGLHVAVMSSSWPVVRDFVTRGADVNASSPETGTSCLMWAIEQRAPETIISQMLQAGGDVCIANLAGKTAVDYAAEEGVSDKVRELIGEYAGGSAVKSA